MAGTVGAQEPWTVGRMLGWTRGYLEGKGDEHPRLSAEWLICNVLGLTRVELYMSFDRVFDQDELAAMRSAVLRRAAGEPLQYVTGEMPFRHIVLRCEHGVLIPRPETEVLVDAALECVDAAVERGCTFDPLPPEAPAATAAGAAGEGAPAAASRDAEPDEGPARPPVSSYASVGAGSDEEDERVDPIVYVPGPEEGRSAYVPGPGEEEPAEPGAEARGGEEAPAAEAPAPGPRVLEVGCGTGCVALSIASERPGTQVVTTDLSPAAVSLARRNRDALGLADAVRVVECDLASGVPEQLMGTFSVLVSNPPYIPSAVVPTLPREVVGFEPGLALDGGPDGLDVFRRLLDLAPRALAPGGALCCELFETTLDDAAALVRAQGGWATVEVREDLTHRPRVLVARREA